MTLKHLYQYATGDLTAHQRTIAAHFARLDARRQRIIRARVAGQSFGAIAAAERVSKGTVQSVINVAMERLEKQIADEPRYNQAGRARQAQSQARR